MKKGLSHSEAGMLGYLASSDIHKKKKQERIDGYYKNPKKCNFCNEDIFYEKRYNKFCSKSCSAKFNNKGIRRHGNSPENCLTCEVKLKKGSSKYCSNKCQQKYQWEQKKNIILEGKCNSQKSLKKFILEKDGHQCSVCKETKWMNQDIPLVLDHIDGNSENNFPKNLRLVCGNCDMQLPTYKSKNTGNGRHSRRIRYAEGKSY